MNESLCKNCVFLYRKTITSDIGIPYCLLKEKNIVDVKACRRKLKEKDIAQGYDRSDLSVYTYGLKIHYDFMLQHHGELFTKKGMEADYAGGIVFNTINDATIGIYANNKAMGTYGVYKLKAIWRLHTIKSVNGYWDVLIKSSQIIKKVKL